MAVYLDDIKDMKLTRTPFYLPINEENKRMGSAIFLLTPNIDSSINLMKHPLTINKRLFESYYLEKNISFIINEYGQYTLPGVGVIDESVADFNMVPDDSFAIHEGYADVRVDGQRSKYLFMDEVEHALTEAANRDGNFSFQLKKLLYSERIKNQKECALIYDKIKEADPFIRYTYLKYSIYKQKNLFIDWSYYTEFFFKNNIYKLDKGVNLYFAFINKFLNDARLSENGYKVKTVFVPIQDWVKPDFLIYDYTKDINPISIIYRIIKSGDELLIQEK